MKKSTKLIRKIIRGVVIFLVTILILMIIWWLLPERTPSISKNGHHSVAQIDYIKIGGVDQCVLLRGHDVNKPIILFLHGGPGMPMMYLAHKFQRPLEEHFLVVQWDRRGAGKTFSRNVPEPESMNIRQILDDTYTLIDTLRNRYGHQQVILAGHSFGTYLGSILVTERPELFKAYISIGQVVDDDRARTIQKQWVRKSAIDAEREDILQSLENEELADLENWLFEFGGELKHSKSFLPLLVAGLKSPEYTLSEAKNVGNGSSFSSKYMQYNVLEGSIYDSITEYKAPVYFFIGTSDYTTPHELVTEYFDRIEAPKKEMVYFQESAHFPFFEEPERFNSEIIRVLKEE